MTDEFEPRLGRIGDRGRVGEAWFAKRVRKAAARLGRRSETPGFSGARIGRGGASCRALEMRPPGVPAYRMRRVIVKTYISRAGQRGGTGALKAHLGYIQRDGVERDGSGGQLYTRDGDLPDAEEFAGRCDGDRHQFRIIVSAEDGAQLGDLKETTRALMAQMESDLGTRLDWLAVDHHNTGHPHTHIVIRGRDARGKDLVIAPDYIRQGLARRAQDIVTDRLGPRRDVEIAQARQAEVTKDRFTEIDRRLRAEFADGQIELKPDGRSGEAVEQALRRGRLRHLEGLGLAAPAGRDSWQMKAGWDASLEAMGRRGDVIQALAAKFRDAHPENNLRLFDPAASAQAPLIGTVLTSLPDDELRDHRSLVIEDFHGRRWMVELGLREPGSIPPEGAVVEVGVAAPKPREIDLSIARIAARTGGVYSEAVHIEVDPGSSPTWRQGHVRRLEALQRAGIGAREAGGSWRVPSDFLGKAMAYDGERTGRLALHVKSWIPLDAQAEYRGLTWIDTGANGLGGERLERARKARLGFLREKGWLPAFADQPDAGLLDRLRRMELSRVTNAIASASGRILAQLATGDRFEGQFEKVVDLGQGRYAVIGNAKGFALVPWRPEIERHRGREMVFRQTVRGVSWTIGNERGMGR
jgi:type IV secretory pathway VirD2 relaxase